MNTSTTTALPVRVAATTSLTTALIGAALLGALMVFATGFSPSEVAHNAAHDVRHANAFPCH